MTSSGMMFVAYDRGELRQELHYTLPESVLAQDKDPGAAKAYFTGLLARVAKDVEKNAGNLEGLTLSVPNPYRKIAHQAAESLLHKKEQDLRKMETFTEESMPRILSRGGYVCATVTACVGAVIAYRSLGAYTEPARHIFAGTVAAGTASVGYFLGTLLTGIGCSPFQRWWSINRMVKAYRSLEQGITRPGIDRTPVRVDDAVA